MDVVTFAGEIDKGVIDNGNNKVTMNLGIQTHSVFITTTDIYLYITR